MRAAGFDYFENSRRAALAQRGYGAANPMGWRGYDENVWGWTACDGPGGGKLTYKGETREFRTYSARGVSGNHPFDDGTIAPTDRKSVVQGKSVSGRVDPGGRRIIKKKKKK